MGAQAVGQLLADKGIIKSALGWKISLYLDGGAEDIQAGKYQLRTGLTPKDALAALLANPPHEDFTTVTFPEGSWLVDFARIIEKNTDLSGAKFLRLLNNGAVTSSLLPADQTSMEGLLFPSTYQVVGRDTEKTLAERLAGQMDKEVASLDFSTVTDMGYTVYDAINVASMVEAEAKVDSDRARIARVIYNRLQKGMTLGIDATISYALGEHKTSLTESDLAVDSPYNTRLVAGLPPTPIGAPGAESLRAAAAPAEGDWLYYVVSDCSGHHAFSVDYNDFLRNKAAYQRLNC
jgi:UPF0755 protein